MKGILQFIIMILALSIVLSGCTFNEADDSKIHDLTVSKCDGKIKELMAKMTIEEKIGQLNMLSGDWAITGPYIRADFKQDIKAGKVGSMLNCYTVDYTRELINLSVD
ncbi:MAG: hypothetical protein KKB74_10095, partial [Bacteroidetes bacterium]|nr:hypothetical protein [Bacteroidota bacterium]